MNIVENTANTNILIATAEPTAAAAHKADEVVNPRRLFALSLKLNPAPITPKPVAIAASILAIADLSSVK